MKIGNRTVGENFYMKYLAVTKCFRTLVARNYQLKKYGYDYHFQ